MRERRQRELMRTTIEKKEKKMWDGTYKKNVIVRGTIAVIDTNFARKHVGNVSSKEKKGGHRKGEEGRFCGLEKKWDKDR